jgi:hypothetical protein
MFGRPIDVAEFSLELLLCTSNGVRDNAFDRSIERLRKAHQTTTSCAPACPLPGSELVEKILRQHGLGNPVAFHGWNLVPAAIDFMERNPALEIMPGTIRNTKNHDVLPVARAAALLHSSRST